METKVDEDEFEILSKDLNDSKALEAYKELRDDYKPGFLPRMIAGSLVWFGNVVYGFRPSYLKFRSIEVIARVPYHSWTTSAFTLLTAFFNNEHKAIDLSCTNEFAQIAQDNETMHVVVISQLAKKEGWADPIRHTLIPLVFAFFYFWASYLLHLINKKWSYEINYLFENHAFEQYNEFITINEESLKSKPLDSRYLAWYGREFDNQYEFFRSVRNDELIHRNTSIEEIDIEEYHQHKIDQ